MNQPASITSKQVMRVLIIIAIIFVVQTVTASDTNIERVVKEGIATSDEIKTLSTNDIPARWRTRVVDHSAEARAGKIFLRGDERVLEVIWKTDWIGSRSNDFTATVYDGEKVIGKVLAFSDAVNIMQPRKTRNDYDMTTSIKTNGLVKVMFFNDKGYLQIIEIRGRDTRLMDDLEYTKIAMLIDGVGKPLVGAIKDGIKNSLKE